jgi:hypothetical protein
VNLSKLDTSGHIAGQTRTVGQVSKNTVLKGQDTFLESESRPLIVHQHRPGFAGTSLGGVPLKLAGEVNLSDAASKPRPNRSSAAGASSYVAPDASPMACEALRALLSQGDGEHEQAIAVPLLSRRFVWPRVPWGLGRYSEFQPRKCDIGSGVDKWTSTNFLTW